MLKTSVAGAIRVESGGSSSQRVPDTEEMIKSPTSREPTPLNDPCLNNLEPLVRSDQEVKRPVPLPRRALHSERSQLDAIRHDRNCAYG